MRLKKIICAGWFCLLCGLLHAQERKTDYDARWKKVDSIKALVERLMVERRKKPAEDTTTIAELKKAVASAREEPMRQILQNLLAGVYWSYFQQNRWKLYNRTNTGNLSSDDITTWTIADFHRRISALYLASLQDEALLEHNGLSYFDPIIEKGNVRHLRPTLFDLLAHEALDYFKSSETDLNQPANVFEIDDTALFADAGDFARHVFHPEDTASLHYKALLLYQRLIRLHLGDARPDALIDVDLDRLGFAKTYAVAEDKEDSYLAALRVITGKYGDLPAAAQAWCLQAEAYADDRKALARAICERVLTERDSSEGKTHCRLLLDELQRKRLGLEGETFNLPGQPFRCLLSWSNFSRLYLRLVRTDSLVDDELLRGQAGYWDKWLCLPVYRAFTQDLPVIGDYARHSAEIPVGSLPPGAYTLLGSTDSSWDHQKGEMAALTFYITSLSFVFTGKEYFVVNRETGNPVAGATVRLWALEHPTPTGKWERALRSTYQTDAQGHFTMKPLTPVDHYEPCFLEISVPGDDVFFSSNYLPDVYSSNRADADENKSSFESSNARTYFFLDRSIYRPGQTVYFKGIVVTQDFDSRQPIVWAGRKTKVSLYNANGEVVDSLEVTTNAFGSYHGAFRLPEHQLNGRFAISDRLGRGNSLFRVEEYKRPRFYVSIDPPKDSYRVGDSIRVEGKAQAYAGNQLDGVTVKYRITREAAYPHVWSSFRWIGRFPQPVTEIGHGEVKTDANGIFHINWKALPDRQVPVSSDPRFTYRVEADVTDINGETRSGTAQVTAGYTALDLSLRLPMEGVLPADSLKYVRVSATNLAGQPVASEVHIHLYPLRAPFRLIRQRYWEAPDTTVLTETAFLDSFPHDEYREELKKEDWAKGPFVWETTVRTDTGKESGDRGLRVDIPVTRVSPGWWLVEATATDPYGHTVREVQYAALYDGKTGRPASPAYNWNAERGTEIVAGPGDQAQTGTGSSATGVYVFRAVGRPDERHLPDRWHIGGDVKHSLSHFTLNDSRLVSEWPVTEEDRGGFSVADVFVRDNRIYTRNYLVRVPWTDKELQIRYTTYRDKTEPGSEEKWSVRISGSKGERAAAEVLTSMYDASLDQFAPQGWATPTIYPELSMVRGWEDVGTFGARPSLSLIRQQPVRPSVLKIYDQLLPVGVLRVTPNYLTAMPEVQADAIGNIAAQGERVTRVLVNEKRFDSEGVERNLQKDRQPPPGQTNDTQSPEVRLRRNFNETAFFFPDLRTDSAGNVSFSFTMPGSLTKWKWMTLAHTRDLAFGYSEKPVVAQKQLMVQPNAPRFIREGDKMNFSVKVVNLTDSEMTGQMGLSLTDPTTGETADGWFVNRQPNQYFTIPAHGSAVVEFPLDIPYQYNRPLTYRVTAQAANFSDGEEATLPVVSDRMLVTETLPITLPGDGTRQYKFDKLLKSGGSETLNHHTLTVELTSNPAWYAVQALPYLMEFPYECAEQTFDRLYANALATKIVNSSPKIAQVFQRWRTTDTASLLSNLEKNQELKSVLLEETPWVLEGKSESQQKKNIALLFDLARMSGELEGAVERLRATQSPDGGFPWFRGGADDRYITQYILTGIGHLRQLKALSPELTAKINDIVSAALPWLDEQIRQDYLHETPLPGGVRRIGALEVQYLYMRSMFNDRGISGTAFSAVNYYRKQAQQGWVPCSPYLQGMIALALYRTGDVQTAKNIIASLRQHAIRSEEEGMYWPGMEGGYYWYQSPIEIESLLIETFQEISGDAGIDRALKTWLLRHKQTNRWPTTKATADAVYALLLGGEDWLTKERQITVQLGDKTVEWAGDTAEAGTGYYKKIFDAPFINPAMGNISVTMQTKGDGGPPAWGAIYWQYFDQLDQITPPGGDKAPLRLTKRLFIRRNTDHGPVLDTIPDGGSIKVGDRVVVRVVLRSDRDLEYVHMKDMRAACLEPVDVLSRYKWQGGLGYYESTKDASTEFFFPRVPRGSYVFEYTLVAGQTGEFSNGVTSVECMYAPEFAFRSEGIRINVEEGQ